MQLNVFFNSFQFNSWMNVIYNLIWINLTHSQIHIHIVPSLNICSISTFMTASDLPMFHFFVCLTFFFFANAGHFLAKVSASWVHHPCYSSVNLKCKNTFRTLPVHTRWQMACAADRKSEGRQRTEERNSSSCRPLPLKQQSRQQQTVAAVICKIHHLIGTGSERTATIISLECSSITRQASYRLAFYNPLPLLVWCKSLLTPPCGSRGSLEEWLVQ